MTPLKKVKSNSDIVGYFKKLFFYKTYIEKANIERLKNNDLLSELLFYEELNIIKTNHAFSGYAMSCKVKVVEKKVQLAS